ncbi:YceI family protein [Cellulophaga baltica]|uniref:YceI family protein n=1 Tax=Cellulophaga TaxID=104264 RepID=UPI001C06C003|nr:MULTISPECIES: YceI family protein [Cellulophaga]MBU2997362.1 YceI family protein [Cellulophaga baltica]MDO6768759.1 YceI family protein [Cellulophaga sp. 1_MG-2023]
MKKTLLILSLAVATLSYSCKEEKKEKKAEEPAKMEHKSMYSLVSDSTKVSFVAYKTTEKLPVGGEFKSIKITELSEGETPLEVLNGSKFSIPVSSLFTNDATGTRDPKITEFFFGAMKDTELISGTFKVDGENASIDVTLNGETANIPLDVTSNSENIYTFSGVMDLKKWNASDAVASLNKVCEALHTGPDGVSKTWDEVAIKADVLFAKN